MLSKAVLQAGGYYFFESKGRSRYDFALTFTKVDNKICNVLPPLAEAAENLEPQSLPAFEKGSEVVT